MSLIDDGYTTPEGYWLARPLILPDEHDFTNLVEYVREWDFATMSHTNGVVPQPDLVPDPVQILRAGEQPQRKPGRYGEYAVNTISPYCSIDLSACGGPKYRGIAIRAKQVVVDAVRDRMVTPDDRLSLRVIGHADRNRALVILEHGYIIGGHWLAYIDPSTIPAVPSC